MRARIASVVAISLVVIAGCAVQQPGVAATRSRQNDGTLIGAGASPDTTPDTTPNTAPNTAPDATPDTHNTTPNSTPDTTPIPVKDGVVDFGANKPQRSYDGFLTAALSDIESFWAQQFPLVYGGDFKPLSGHVYAAYPERTDPIPGCGTPETTYLDVEGNAFYCVNGDFMVYDDNELLPQLVKQLGQSAIAIVLAHEFGHAVQFRANEFKEPTILKEQQADCFAGAWAAHVSRGESDVIKFTDEDLSGGLIAMIQVRDPVDLGGQPIDANAHGTGFDRVGAFQDGFLGGPARCKTFFTENRENQLINLPFDPNEPSGNLPLVDQNPDPTKGPVDIVTLLPADLNRYWTAQLAASKLTLTAPKVTLFSEEGDPPKCDGIDGSKFNKNIVYCKASNTIFVDQDFAETSDADPLLGDMSVGYLISQGYSENVQALLGSKLTGSARALLDDCLTGSWIKDDLPSDTQSQDKSRELSLSAGDLDEAIVTAIIRGDKTSDTNVNGTAFQKVDAFRSGVLGGMPACQDRITP